MKVLVTGGAGYIGSHMVKMLLAGGAEVVIIDNLSSGHMEAVVGGEFVRGDLADRELLQRLFVEHKFDGVIHFAAFIQVGESVKQPAKYYQNNVVTSLDLLDAMVAHGVKRLVFSSSAAVFGESQYTPIDESHAVKPISPYGFSKWAIERMLIDYDQAYGLKYVSLRYFNVAGADPDGELGERHEPEIHLIPRVLQVASGRMPAIEVYGRNYRTPDGTCVRDYIHVMDLCQAHLLALERLLGSGGSTVYNLGSERGFSVQEVITAAERVTARKISVVDAPRREGDPAVLVADASRARLELGWTPEYGDLDAMIWHAWAWEKRLADTAEDSLVSPTLPSDMT